MATAIFRVLRLKRKPKAKTVPQVMPVVPDDEYTDSSPELYHPREQSRRSKSTGHLHTKPVGTVHPANMGHAQNQEETKPAETSLNRNPAPSSSWLPKVVPEELLDPAGLEKRMAQLGLSPRSNSALASPLITVSSAESNEDRCPKGSASKSLNRTYTHVSLESEPDVALFTKPPPSFPRTNPNYRETPKSRRRTSDGPPKRLPAVTLWTEDRQLFKSLESSPAIVKLTKFTRMLSPNVLVSKMVGKN